MEEHAVVNVVIDNFKRIKRCPYCGEKPTQMKWSDGILEMWCRNLKCPNEAVHITQTYPPDCVDLIGLTKSLIGKWGHYCRDERRKKRQAEV